MAIRRAPLIFAILMPIGLFLSICVPIARQGIDQASAEGATSDDDEAHILSEVPAIVRRENDALFVTLRDGRERVYEDHTRACAANDAVHCVRHRASEYDPQRNVLVLLNRYYEGTDHELISLESGDSVKVSGDLQSGPGGRPYWAAVDDGEYGPGDMQIVALENGAFRVLGQVNHPQCNFNRWDGDQAFFVICWGLDDKRGEYQITLGADATLQVSRTSRSVTDEEYRAIGVVP